MVISMVVSLGSTFFLKDDIIVSEEWSGRLDVLMKAIKLEFSWMVPTSNTLYLDWWTHQFDATGYVEPPKVVCYSNNILRHDIKKRFLSWFDMAILVLI